MSEKGQSNETLTVRANGHDKRLKELHDSQTRLFKKLDELIPAVAELKVKAGIWGGLGGLITVAVSLGVAVLIKLF